MRIPFGANTAIARMPKIMMLLPIMREDLFDRLAEHGVDIGIGKPIIASVLFNGLLELFKAKATAAATPAQRDAAPQARRDLPGRPCCVLVVEDNKTNQLIAKSLLEQDGNISVLLADDGQEGVSRRLSVTNRRSVWS